jgi:uncharacterized protein
VIETLLTALGLVLLLEGILYGFFPDAMRRMMAQVMNMPTEALQRVALLTAFIGLGIIYFVQRF